MPCQDSKKIVKISDDIVIIAVADGHGSEKCPRSDRGSTIAVNTFCEVMKNYLQSYGSDENGLSNLITFLNREGDMRFAQDICEEWQARVKQSYYDYFNLSDQLIAKEHKADTQLPSCSSMQHNYFKVNKRTFSFLRRKEIYTSSLLYSTSVS